MALFLPAGYRPTVPRLTVAPTFPGNHAGTKKFVLAVSRLERPGSCRPVIAEAGKPWVDTVAVRLEEAVKLQRHLG